MLKKLFTLLCITLVMVMANAQKVVSITPLPQNLIVKSGTYVLPANFTYSAKGLSEGMQEEMNRFAKMWQQTLGVCPRSVTIGGQLSLSYDETLAEESYALDITKQGVTISASTSKGLFYAFQSLIALMPVEVRAGEEMSLKSLQLPCLEINDSPRFAYRGFMLDVSRHFFSVEEVCKILRLMAAYKMNAFHWHLTDDQGWRLEIKKYPRLTTVGATASNCYSNSMEYGPYWTNAKYGPHYYTHEDIRRVVRYADSLHIDIIPEIDMPGHFTAAMVAYPEFSCKPNVKRTVWTHGGISPDVLNVANPKAVQFAQDVLTEVMDLFPGKRIHIGGDECPVAWWKENSEAKKLYADGHFTDYRQLQSRFIAKLGQHVAKRGRELAVWNEAITAGGVDLSAVKGVTPYVYCWTPITKAIETAVRNQLPAIVTAYGPYYINRKQTTEHIPPSAAGNGADNLAATYNYRPLPSSLKPSETTLVKGVQGTFWTEHVSDTTYLEYLALPRLFAIAETGWSPERKKRYDSFVKRLNADTAYWNKLHFNYCRTALNEDREKKVVYPIVSTEDEKIYYTITSMAFDKEREGRCLELLSSDSPLLTKYASKGAKVGRVWTALASKENQYQCWALEQDKQHPERFALVCEAIPEGSLKGRTTNASVSGRWEYDTKNKHYDFLLGEKAYGKKGDAYYYTIRSIFSSNYLNAAMGGQGMAANLYVDPLSGNGGVWLFKPLFETYPDVSDKVLEILRHAKIYKQKPQMGCFEETALENLRQSYDEWLKMDEGQREAHNKQLAEALRKCEEAFCGFQEGAVYSLSSEVDGKTVYLQDIGGMQYVSYTEDATELAAQWKASKVEGKGIRQNVMWENLKTKRGGFIKLSLRAYVGCPMTMRNKKSICNTNFFPRYGGFTLSLENSENFYPLSKKAPEMPGIVAAGTWMNNKLVSPNPLQGVIWKAKQLSETSIEEVQQKYNKSVIYDICGKRIKKAQHGVFIIDGKKQIR